VAEPVLAQAFIDGHVVKAHQHSSGAANGRETAACKPAAGDTAKILMAAGAFGLLINLEKPLMAKSTGISHQTPFVG